MNQPTRTGLDAPPPPHAGRRRACRVTTQPVGRRMRWALMCGCSLGFAGLALAGRPLTVNDTEPVAAGRWQLEASGAYRHEPACDHWEVPLTLAYGLRPRLDVGVGLGGQLEERSEWTQAGRHADGLGDLTVFPRWKFYEQAHGLPSQALQGTVKFPTADHHEGLGSGATDYDLTWIATARLTDRWQLDANLGYSWIGQPENEEEAAADIVHYGVAVEYQIWAPLQWVGEVFAERDTAGATTTRVQYNSGVRWAVREGLTLDLAAGSKLSGEAPDFIGTTGLTWVFGAP